MPGCCGLSRADCPSSAKCRTCPFTGEVLAAVPAVRPDVTVIHAQKADRKGNVLYVGFYAYQDLYLTAALYGLFTAIAIAGWRDWQRDPALRT